MIANRSIMFMGPRMNLSLRGLQASLVKYSSVKKPTVIRSTTSITWTQNYM